MRALNNVFYEEDWRFTIACTATQCEPTVALFVVRASSRLHHFLRTPRSSPMFDVHLMLAFSYVRVPHLTGLVIKTRILNNTPLVERLNSCVFLNRPRILAGPKRYIAFFMSSDCRILSSLIPVRHTGNINSISFLKLEVELCSIRSLLKLCVSSFAGE